MTQFTSFVAVEERVVNQNGKPVTIQVPVELPDGMAVDVVATGVDQSSVTTGTNVSTEYFSNIPASRTVSGLYTVAPTTARSGLRDATGRQRNPSVAGSSGPENNFVLDGVSAKNGKKKRQKRGSGSGGGLGDGTGSGSGTGVGYGYGYGSGSGSAPPPPPPPLRAPQTAQPRTPVTSLEGRRMEKMHIWIYDLVARIESGKKAAGNEAFFVYDGKARIEIVLTVMTPALMDRLKALGFELAGEEKGKIVGLWQDRTEQACCTCRDRRGKVGTATAVDNVPHKIKPPRSLEAVFSINSILYIIGLEPICGQTFLLLSSLAPRYQVFCP